MNTTETFKHKVEKTANEDDATAMEAGAEKDSGEPITITYKETENL